MEPNHWHEDRWAEAFWDQRQALPYQELLHDTANWLDPLPDECWLDLGCGSGQLTAAIWERSCGSVGQIVAVDCAAANERAIAKLRRRLQPRPGPDQIRFVTADFSHGLPDFAANSFDGIVSGLAISYAESFDPETGQYTDAAYDFLLRELHRVLRPGGRLVFSVNCPNPRYGLIFWKSLRRAPRISKPGRVLFNAVRMLWLGRWLKREARRGRFHFFPVEEIARRLERAGFRDCRFRLTYAGQAYLIAAVNRAEPARSAA